MKKTPASCLPIIQCTIFCSICLACFDISELTLTLNSSLSHRETDTQTHARRQQSTDLIPLSHVQVNVWDCLLDTVHYVTISINTRVVMIPEFQWSIPIPVILQKQKAKPEPM